jgi:hypothetical protein
VTCPDRTARELLTQGRPLFLGVDGEGAAHYWDSYEFAVAVVSADGDAEHVVLAETPFETLLEWCEYTRGERGWDVVRTLAARSSVILVEVLKCEIGPLHGREPEACPGCCPSAA